MKIWNQTFITVCLLVLLVLVETRKKGKRGRGSGGRRKTPKKQTLLQQRMSINVIAPHSGQIIRFGGNSSFYNAGLVEVYRGGRWGVVCDDKWDNRDATVVCRQLGFRSGSLAAPGASLYGSADWSTDDILMDETECTGMESRVQECPYSAQHDCQVNEAASVICQKNAGCPGDWINGTDGCYKLFGNAKDLQVAIQKCYSIGSHLVTIETEAENNFLSNLLYLSSSGDELWLTGGKKSGPSWVWEQITGSVVTQTSSALGRRHRHPGRGRGRTRQQQKQHVYSKKEFSMSYVKWFPGWQPVGSYSWQPGRYGAEPSDESDEQCMALRQQFPHPTGTDKAVHYYWWDDVPCRNKKGMNFICEKSVPVIVEECFRDNGTDYRGFVAHTDKGTYCKKWSDSVYINAGTHPDRGLGEHNYCRNPDDDKQPWCWTNVIEKKFGYCSILPCRDNTDELPTDTPPEPETPTETLGLDCPLDKFYCPSREIEDVFGKCIPDIWRCDGEVDCSMKEDEANCEYKLPLFEKHIYQAMKGHEKEQYSSMPIEWCANHCVEVQEYVCRSFSYNEETQECITSEANIQTVGEPTDDLDFNYYELTTQQMDCEMAELFLCGNRKCLIKSKICDGVDDCGDFSDEEQCGDETQSPIQVRILNGGEHSGRVEINYRGEWGIVCDDNWQLADANVVCRMLGYANGAVRASVLSEFGSGNQNFLLDNVNCVGNETSLEDCEKDPWKQHDCKSYEAAGVVCQSGKVCDDTEFQCSLGNCIPVAYVCDGDNDCAGNSDEHECEVHVELVGGRQEMEGRVEIIRNGVRGTVCDDGWDNKDAAVICKMLGYPSGRATVAAESTYGPGAGLIWLDDVGCTGRESSISECEHRGWGRHNCEHTEDVGVVCLTQLPPTTEATQVISSAGEIECGKRPLYHSRNKRNEPFLSDGPRIGKIFGGNNAEYGLFPWQVGVRKIIAEDTFWGTRDVSHWCGGTVISEYWVLSAAHCFDSVPKTRILIRTGDLNNKAADTYEQEFEVEVLAPHELYDSDSFDNDLALIKVKPIDGHGIVFNDFVQPACLPDENTPHMLDKDCHISGWGKTQSGYPNMLKSARVPILDPTVCRAIYKGELSDKMFCAGVLRGGVDTCAGDSGGPLVCEIEGKYTVLGATSWGRDCGMPNSPGVYAKVKNFLPWIRRKLRIYS